MIVNKKQVKHLGYRCIGPTITPEKIEQLKKGLGKNRELEKKVKLLFK